MSTGCTHRHGGTGARGSAVRSRLSRAGLLGALAATVGLGAAGWRSARCAPSSARSWRWLGARRPGWARPTGSRWPGRCWSCGVAALVAARAPAGRPVLVRWPSSRWSSTRVDGRVARRTGTVSALGARFDMEVDAFLILVLSVYVAPTVGLVGARASALARYALVAAGWVLPWLRGAAAAAALAQGRRRGAGDRADGRGRRACCPRAVVRGRCSLVALALLAESFGRDVWWLWRRPRHGRASDRAAAPAGAAAAAPLLAARLLVWLALVLPDDLRPADPVAFVRIPLEALVLVARRAAAAARRPAPRPRSCSGSLLGAAGGRSRCSTSASSTVLDRPFDPVNDWVYLGPGVGVLGDSIGAPAAIAAWSARSWSPVLARARRGRWCCWPGAWRAARRTSATVAAPRSARAGSSCAVVRAARRARRAGRRRRSAARRRLRPGARRSAADLARPARLRRGRSPHDPLRRRPRRPAAGRAARQGRARRLRRELRPGGGAGLVVLARRRRRARRRHRAGSRAAGFAARSAFLTSPTFGAASWLAHSTLQSGLWVDSQQRYDQLLRARPADADLGVRRGPAGAPSPTCPANTRDWPEGAGVLRLRPALRLAGTSATAGPEFGYAPMPDQYTLSAFQRLELATRSTAGR